MCSSQECAGKPQSESAHSAAYARQADTFAVGDADVTQLASSSTSRSPAGRIRFLANAAGGSIDSDMMASWPDATAGGRHPMGATGVSVRGLPAQDHQVRYRVGAWTGPCAVHAVRWPSTQCATMHYPCTRWHASLRGCIVHYVGQMITVCMHILCTFQQHLRHVLIQPASCPPCSCSYAKPEMQVQVQLSNMHLLFVCFQHHHLLLLMFQKLHRECRRTDAGASHVSNLFHAASCVLLQVSGEMAHTRHASPRNMLRQAAFLGQPCDFPPAGWNTSVNPHSSRHASEDIAQPLGATAMDAEPSTAAATSATAVEGTSTATLRSTAVVCKAVGSGRPHVPSLGLASLRADRHRKGLQTLHGRVSACQLSNTGRL